MQMKEYLQQNFGYTDFQIRQLVYVKDCLVSEISKLIIMGIFFSAIGKFSLFAVSGFVLLLIRTWSGGLHFKHYLSCLLVSFLVFYLGVCVLNPVTLPKIYQLVLLLGCILTHIAFAPIVSATRPIPNGILVRKSKVHSFTVIFLYALILYIVPPNQYINVGFWIIVLQSLQLAIANFTQKRRQTA